MKSTRHDNYDKLVKEWAKASQECGRTYNLWMAARERRERLARLKREAWLELAGANEQIARDK